MLGLNQIVCRVKQHPYVTGIKYWNTHTIVQVYLFQIKDWSLQDIKSCATYLSYCDLRLGFIRISNKDQHVNCDLRLGFIRISNKDQHVIGYHQMYIVNLDVATTNKTNWIRSFNNLTYFDGYNNFHNFVHM